MMPAAKHGDPQLGVDVHLCVVPPSPSPVPLPTPHMSVVFDPMDYLPVIGATVTVCGMKRAVAGTSGQAVHIPPGFPFAPKLPDKDDELFMGSATVEADGDPFSFLGVPVLACQAVGMPSPPRPRRKGGPRIMMLPTVFNLAIPTNVFVGGPPTISLMGMAFKAGLAGLGRLARSNFARALGARFQAWRKAKFGHLKPGFLKCKVLRAEPVNIVTGAVSVAQADFVLPGLIPIRWTRRYASDNPRRGACGVGWETPADARLEHDAESGVVLFHHPDGEIAIFPAMPAEAGEAGAVLELMDGARLSDHGDEFRVRTKEDRIYRFPKALAADAGGQRAYPLGQVHDLCGNVLVYERSGGVLVGIRESAGRRLVIENGPDGLIRRIGLEVPENGFRHVFVEYEQDAAGDLVAVRDALGHPYRFAYDRHHMLRHTDRNGLSFHYEYDRGGETWRVVRAWGDGGLHAYRFAYLDAVNERRITDSLGQVSLVKLDERGLPISEIDPLGGVTIFEYDEAGRTTAVVDPDGHRTEYAFDERGNLTSLARADGSVDTTEFSATNQPVTMTDARGSIWRQEFCARGLVTRQLGPLGGERRFAYDATGRMVGFVSPTGGETRLERDRYGNRTRVTDPAGGVTALVWDELGRLAMRTDPAGRRNVYRYDAAGRPVEIVLPGGGTIALAYDPEGNLVRRIDPDGGVTRFEYRGIGQLAARIGADGDRTDYRYDTEERLIAVRNPRGEVHRLVRDALGRVVEETDYWGQTRRYGYSAAGHLRWSRDPAGREIRYETDGLGRVLRKLSPAAAGDGIVAETFSYDPMGELVAHESGSFRVERLLDAEGRVTEERQGEDAVLRHAYDANGNVTRRTVLFAQDGDELELELRQAWDAADRVVAHEIPDVARLERRRDASGRVVGDGIAAWGLARRFALGPGAQVTGVQVMRAGRVLIEQGFHRDAVGNLRERHDSALGVDAYRYSPGGRLVAHDHPDWGTELHATDIAGDRLPAAAGTADETGAWRRSGSVGGVTYRFDAAGNLVERDGPGGRLDLVWDANNQLVESSRGGIVTRYRYDALGRRVAKQTGDVVTRYLWSGDLLVGEAVLAPHKVRLRAWAHDAGSFVPLLLAERVATAGGASAARGWLAQCDPHGCPTRLVDSEGRIAWLAAHNAWGGARGVTGSTDNPLRLQGQYADDETGLHYNRYRYFDPELGQFLSQDPLGLAAGTNPYAYAPNVFAWIDPLGLACLLDNNTLAAAVEGTPADRARVMAAIRAQGRPVMVPDRITDEFLAPRANGVVPDRAALNDFLNEVGATMIGDPSRAAQAAEQRLARSLTPPRALHRGGDAVLAAAARETGATVITNDQQLRNFLNAPGVGLSGAGF